MKTHAVKRRILAPEIGLLLLTACSQWALRPPLAPVAPTAQLSDNKRITGEIMAYLDEQGFGRLLR